jgi:hypothetical protein
VTGSNADIGTHTGIAQYGAAMRFIPFAGLTLTTLALAACASFGDTGAAPSVPTVAKDAPKICSEAPQLIGSKLSEFSSKAQQPKDLKKALAKSVDELEAMAAGSPDATIKDAVQGLAAELKKLKSTDQATAVQSAQNAISAGTASMQRIAEACQ